MKRFILFIILLATVVIAYFFYFKFTIDASRAHNEGDYVVLLHGLGRTSLSMQKIGRHLAKEGYKVINVNYPSRHDTVENLSLYLNRQIETKYTDRTKKINFVTHSMGGIVVRHYLANNELENIGRVVMIAPPNQGSDTADRLSQYKVVNYVMGPALIELRTDADSLANSIPLPQVQYGVIAGEYDEKVAVERTKLSNMTDFIIVPKEHTWIAYTDQVVDLVIKFLRTGAFE